jgi:hypothetical protein
MTTTRKLDIALAAAILVVLTLLALYLAPALLLAQNEPARVLLLGGHFDRNMERMNLVLDVSTPGTYRLVIERRGKVTRLMIEDVKTQKVIWVGKLEKEE